MEKIDHTKPSTEEIALSEARDQKIKDRLLSLVRSGAYEEINDDIVKYVERLKEKYDDAMNHTVLHALIGSSGAREFLPDFSENDFPGDDSVEKFVETLEKKYKK